MQLPLVHGYMATGDLLMMLSFGVSVHIQKVRKGCMVSFN